MILFGGVRDGAYRFCNNKCHQNAYVLRVAQAVPADVLERQTEEVSGQLSQMPWTRPR
jgi:hypothetical protein